MNDQLETNRTVLVRIWTTSFDVSQKAKLLQYANDVSLPVLSSRPGCKGVLFFCLGNLWTTQTFWDKEASIAALDNDPEYRRIVAGILELDVLAPDQDTKVFELVGGTLFPAMS